ncbi:MAG: response regulator transcription factor [Chloroflexi bacterium]|nr:response regulator transcription factor [Chloroflexota bacterium]
MSLEWDGAETLTRREREVVLLVVEGRRNREIAETLGISQKTVESHIKNILLKLGVHNRVQIAIRAVTYQAGVPGLLPEAGSR